MMRSMALVVLLGLVGSTSLLSGCGERALDLPLSEKHCHAQQSSPVSIGVDAAANGCRGPGIDGIHVEIQTDDYLLIVVSPDGFSVGEHSVQTSGFDGQAHGATMTVHEAEGGWLLDVRAGLLAVTLSGD